MARQFSDKQCRGSLRGMLGLSLGVVVTLTACGTDRTTAPEISMAPLAALRSMAPVAEPAGFVRCEIGKRAADGSYRTFLARFRVDERLQSAANRRNRFYLPKESAATDPLVVVACEIPSTAAAEEYFNQIFKSIVAAKPNNGINSLSSTTSDFKFGTAGLMDEGDCPPEALQCDITSGGEWDGPPPTGPTPTSRWRQNTAFAPVRLTTSICPPLCPGC